VGAEDVLLVYGGRVASEKNLPLLLRAYAAIAHELSNVRLLIVGGGPKTILAHLKTLAADLGVGNRVRFTGSVPYEAVAAHLLMCDAFATPSVSEVHPLSVIEGMACGLPVVGIDSPGVGDMVEDGKTGFDSGELADFTALEADLRC
jgi:glycosyltransferase involved in cell wall biosynthesis